MLSLLSLVLVISFFQNCSPVKIAKNSDFPIANNPVAISNYAPKSVGGSQVITGGNVILKEYRHKSTNRFFYTSRTPDQSLVATTYASLFEATGNTITLKAAMDAGLSPVYRLFNKGGFHFYTADSSDKNISLSDDNFFDEGVEGYAVKINQNATCPNSPTATFPVYQLLHVGSYKYRLVTDSVLKSQLVTQGYSDKGILFCATAVSSSPPVGRANCTNSSSQVHSSVTADTGYKQFHSLGIIGQSAIYTIRVTVSAATTTAGSMQRVLISHTEGIASQRARRTLVLSPCIGDFTSAEAIVLATNSSGSTEEVTVNDAGHGVPNLTTGTWYINIKNEISCAPTAPCDMTIDWLFLKN